MGGRSSLNGKAVVARIHARAGRAEQARRWLGRSTATSKSTSAESAGVGALRAPNSGDRCAPCRPPPPGGVCLARRDGSRAAEPSADAGRCVLAAERNERRPRPSSRPPSPGARRSGRADRPCRTFETLGLRDRADADLAEATRRKPDDPRPWVARGRLLAERGDGPAADAAYVPRGRARPGPARPVPRGRLVGRRAVSRGHEPAPAPRGGSRPVAARRGRDRHAAALEAGRVNEDRYLHSGHSPAGQRSSVYAMTHLASDRERTAMLCSSGGDRLRVWLNGRVVFDWDQPHTYHLGPEFLAPVTLRAGRNTLLVRVSHGSDGHRLRSAIRGFRAGSRVSPRRIRPVVGGRQPLRSGRPARSVPSSLAQAAPSSSWPRWAIATAISAPRPGWPTSTAAPPIPPTWPSRWA